MIVPNEKKKKGMDERNIFQFIKQVDMEELKNINVSEWRDYAIVMVGRFNPQETTQLILDWFGRATSVSTHPWWVQACMYIFILFVTFNTISFLIFSLVPRTIYSILYYCCCLHRALARRNSSNDRARRKSITVPWSQLQKVGVPREDIMECFGEISQETAREYNL